MSFEEDFPSLLGYTAEYGDTIDLDGSTYAKCVSAGINYGSLFSEGPVIHTYDVEKHCLDKQRVREVIVNYHTTDDSQEDMRLKLLKELGLNE